MTSRIWRDSGEPPTGHALPCSLALAPSHITGLAVSHSVSLFQCTLAFCLWQTWLRNSAYSAQETCLLKLWTGLRYEAADIGTERGLVLLAGVKIHLEATTVKSMHGQERGSLTSI